MSYYTPEAWIRAGFEVLMGIGEGGLTIAQLSKRLGITQGSFYHHFKNRQDFSEQLLALWEKEMTDDLVTAMMCMENYPEMNQLLRRLTKTIHTNFQLEIAIRAWAWRDPMAKIVQERVDSKRLKFLQHQAGLLLEDHEKARVMSYLRYALFVGASQMLPEIRGNQYQKLDKALMELYGIT